MFSINLLHSPQWGCLPCRRAGARAYVWSRLRVFFHFSVFFLLFGPLGRGDPRPAARPGPGLCLEPASRIFFTLAFFSLFGPLRRGDPRPAARPGPGLMSGAGFAYFFHFSVFFNFWPEVKKIQNSMIYFSYIHGTPPGYCIAPVIPL